MIYITPSLLLAFLAATAPFAVASSPSSLEESSPARFIRVARDPSLPIPGVAEGKPSDGAAASRTGKGSVLEAAQARDGPESSILNLVLGGVLDAKPAAADSGNAFSQVGKARNAKSSLLHGLRNHKTGIAQKEKRVVADVPGAPVGPSLLTEKVQSKKPGFGQVGDKLGTGKEHLAPLVSVVASVTGAAGDVKECKPLVGPTATGYLRIVDTKGTLFGFIANEVSTAIHSYTLTQDSAKALLVTLGGTPVPSTSPFNIFLPQTPLTAPDARGYPVLGATDNRNSGGALGRGSWGHAYLLPSKLSLKGKYQSAETPSKKEEAKAESQIWSTKCEDGELVLGAAWTNEDGSHAHGRFYVSTPGTDKEYIGFAGDYKTFSKHYGAKDRPEVVVQFVRPEELLN